MKNRFELDLDDSITRLAGFEYGKTVYEEQVKGEIDFDAPIVIIFPDNIKKIASSFVQGFFGELMEKIGVSGIKSQVEVESINPQLKNSIVENLL